MWFFNEKLVMVVTQFGVYKTGKSNLYTVVTSGRGHRGGFRVLVMSWVLIWRVFSLGEVVGLSTCGMYAFLYLC